MIDATTFRADLLRVPPHQRDAWVNRFLGLGEIPDDAPNLPPGCVPYLPCPIDPLLRMIERAPLGASDVLVDVGSGLGRAAVVVHLLTGAKVVGVEIQTELVVAARTLARRLGLAQVSFVEGDAAQAHDALEAGSTFFLYCPFGGERLTTLLGTLERVARERTIRVCCLDLPLPALPWLALQEEVAPGDLVIYRSRS